VTDVDAADGADDAAAETPDDAAEDCKDEGDAWVANDVEVWGSGEVSTALVRLASARLIAASRSNLLLSRSRSAADIASLVVSSAEFPPRARCSRVSPSLPACVLALVVVLVAARVFSSSIEGRFPRGGVGIRRLPIAPATT
jgi:hypothetical protein